MFCMLAHLLPIRTAKSGLQHIPELACKFSVAQKYLPVATVAVVVVVAEPYLKILTNFLA